MKQPKALRLANALRDGTYLLSVERDVTADELVRLHEANQAMLEVLKEIVEMWDAFVPTELTAEPHLKARAAIAKGEQS